MHTVARALLAVIVFAHRSPAQASQPALSVARTIETAIHQSNAGRIVQARSTIDSLVGGTAADSPQMADVLFARAALAPSVLDASLDYERIISEFPSSPRREQSMLRMAQRSLVAGDDSKALGYLQAMARDYRADSSLAIASYWMARALIDQRDVTGACSAIREAKRHADAAASALPADITTQSAALCATTVRSGDLASVTRAPREGPASLRGVASNARTLYAVQVAAYPARADADATALRLKATGLDAHVDGRKKPFRVRVGHYDTYAEAAAALRELQKRRLRGFIAEIEP